MCWHVKVVPWECSRISLNALCMIDPFYFSSATVDVSDPSIELKSFKKVGVKFYYIFL